MFTDPSEKTDISELRKLLFGRKAIKETIFQCKITLTVLLKTPLQIFCHRKLGSFPIGQFFICYSKWHINKIRAQVTATSFLVSIQRPMLCLIGSPD